MLSRSFFFFQAEDGIRDGHVTGVQTCALPISSYQKGLLKVVNDEPTILYNETNSPLNLGEGSTNFGIRLYGLDFDNQENLWFRSEERRVGKECNSKNTTSD